MPPNPTDRYIDSVGVQTESALESTFVCALTNARAAPNQFLRVLNT